MSDFVEKVAGMSGFHTVRKSGDKWACTCQGFKFHGKCKHIKGIIVRNIENELLEKYERGEDITELKKKLEEYND